MRVKSRSERYTDNKSINTSTGPEKADLFYCAEDEVFKLNKKVKKVAASLRRAFNSALPA